jgi:hypothetical protein
MLLINSENKTKTFFYESIDEWANCMGCELYLNKAGMKKRKN